LGGPSISLAARPSTRGPPPRLRGLRHNGAGIPQRRKSVQEPSRERTERLPPSVIKGRREPGRKSLKNHRARDWLAPPARARNAHRGFGAGTSLRAFRLPPVGARRRLAPESPFFFSSSSSREGAHGSSSHIYASLIYAATGRGVPRGERVALPLRVGRGARGLSARQRHTRNHRERWSASRAGGIPVVSQECNRCCSSSSSSRSAACSLSLDRPSAGSRRREGRATAEPRVVAPLGGRSSRTTVNSIIRGYSRVATSITR
jgi:hypothetical protein